MKRTSGSLCIGVITMTQKEAYVAPALAEAGSFEAITQSTLTGTRGDFRAAQGAPTPILS